MIWGEMKAWNNACWAVCSLLGHLILSADVSAWCPQHLSIFKQHGLLLKQRMMHCGNETSGLQHPHEVEPFLRIGVCTSVFHKINYTSQWGMWLRSLVQWWVLSVIQLSHSHQIWNCRLWRKSSSMPLMFNASFLSPLLLNSTVTL